MAPILCIGEAFARGTMLFRPLKMGGTLDSGLFYYFFLAKLATTNNHRTELSDMSY